MAIEFFVRSSHNHPFRSQVPKNIVVSSLYLMRMQMLYNFNERNHLELTLFHLRVALKKTSFEKFDQKVLISLILDSWLNWLRSNVLSIKQNILILPQEDNHHRCPFPQWDKTVRIDKEVAKVLHCHIPNPAHSSPSFQWFEQAHENVGTDGEVYQNQSGCKKRYFSTDALTCCI